MTQELLDLRNAILSGRYTEALEIVDELEEMSRASRILNIESYVERMLVHLIKNQVEQRLTASWRASIRDSVLRIGKLNLKDNKTSHYISRGQWQEQLDDAFILATASASDEVCHGKYSEFELFSVVDRGQVYQVARRLLDLTYQYKSADLVEAIRRELANLPGGSDI